MVAALRNIIALAALAVAIAALACTAPTAEPTTPTEPPMPTPTQPTAPNGSVQEVVVGPEQVECTGSAPQLCLIIDGELFYDEIEGFEYEAGYIYRLRIEEYDRWPGQTEIPQDAGRYGYRLLELLAKTPAPGR